MTTMLTSLPAQGTYGNVLFQCRVDACQCVRGTPQAQKIHGELGVSAYIFMLHTLPYR